MSQKSEDSQRPELLAPAGTIEAGLTAFDAGADAVYAGLERFNARERGQNFSFEELSKLTAFAHKNNKRVYVTLNTLLKENELDDVVGILTKLAVIRPDALIVQDLGLVRILRLYFPELEVHASTQMAIHNSSGIRVAEKLGIKRVILERQVTFQEIREIRKKTDLELEIFIHGALCCSRSGICLFSSWMGGWSGNRGKCKQPCRRRYFAKKGNGFFFSPSDLASLEEIPLIKKMSIQGLKIEGRLRKPDYVRRVVTAYRMMLNAKEHEQKEVLNEAKGILSGALGRKWHKPFVSGKSFSDTIRHDTLGASGLLVGKVSAPVVGGFEVKPSRAIHLYDTLRIQPISGDEGPSLTVTKLFQNRKRVKKVSKNQTCFIPFDVPVEKGSHVFKIGSATDDLSGRVKKLPIARPVLDLDIEITDNEIIVSLLGGRKTWRHKVDFKKAQKKPILADDIAEQFRKTRSDKFASGNISVSTSGDLFIPASVLKRTRRFFWEWVDQSIKEKDIETVWEERQKEFIENEKIYKRRSKTKPETVMRFSAKARKQPSRGAIVAQPIEGKLSKRSEVILPEFCPETQIEALKKNIDRLVNKGTRRFRVTSLYGLDLLPEKKGLSLSVSFPVPVCNSLALKELEAFGVIKAMAWVELDKTSLDGLIKKCGPTIEVFSYGRLPILSTRMEVPVSGFVRDSRGNSFRIEREGMLTQLYPEKVLSLDPPKNVSIYVDLSHARPNDKNTTDFNYLRDFV